MRLTIITSAILGAALAMSLCGVVLVRELSKQLASPSWNRKRAAWILLIGCESVAMFDRIYHGGSGRWTALLYISLFTLAVAGMVDSYRLMLRDLTMLYKQLRRDGHDSPTKK